MVLCCNEAALCDLAPNINLPQKLFFLHNTLPSMDTSLHRSHVRCHVFILLRNTDYRRSTDEPPEWYLNMRNSRLDMQNMLEIGWHIHSTKAGNVEWGFIVHFKVFKKIACSATLLQFNSPKCVAVILNPFKVRHQSCDSFRRGLHSRERLISQEHVLWIDEVLICLIVHLQ